MESFRSKVVTIYDTVSSVQWDASHGREPVKEWGGVETEYKGVMGHKV